MKGISERLTKWVHIYIMNCIITLMLSNTEIEKNTVIAEVSQTQSLLLSLILYLFYTAELLDICNNSNKRLSASVFINNITLLTYEFFTEINCCMLIQAHDQCLNWACKYDIFFASEKYELIHLTCWLKRFNMRAQLQLKNIVKKFSISVHILDIWLDFKLCWNEHIKMIKHKMITQINTLLHIMIFIWEITFISTQQIYSIVIRSALIYESAVWHLLSLSE